MKNYDFIHANIGNSVYLTADGDLGMEGGKIKQYIREKTPLTLIKLTKAGKAYLKDSNGEFLSVPTRNVREVVY